MCFLCKFFPNKFHLGLFFKFINVKTCAHTKYDFIHSHSISDNVPCDKIYKQPSQYQRNHFHHSYGKYLKLVHLMNIKYSIVSITYYCFCLYTIQKWWQLLSLIRLQFCWWLLLCFCSSARWSNIIMYKCKHYTLAALF